MKGFLPTCSVVLAVMGLLCGSLDESLQGSLVGVWGGFVVGSVILIAVEISSANDWLL